MRFQELQLPLGKLRCCRGEFQGLLQAGETDIHLPDYLVTLYPHLRGADLLIVPEQRAAAQEQKGNDE